MPKPTSSLTSIVVRAGPFAGALAVACAAFGGAVGAGIAAGRAMVAEAGAVGTVAGRAVVGVTIAVRGVAGCAVAAGAEAAGAGAGRAAAGRAVGAGMDAAGLVHAALDDCDFAAGFWLGVKAAFAADLFFFIFSLYASTGSAFGRPPDFPASRLLSTLLLPKVGPALAGLTTSCHP